MKRLLMLFVLFGLIAVVAQAQTLIRVPLDQPTVQAGINAAVDGDTVLVAEGTYVENVKINKKIILGSLFIQDGDTSHISKTIIDGSGSVNPDSGSTITLGSATDTSLVISGFTITGGKGNIAIVPGEPNYLVGGGIQSAVGGTARITRNTITGNNIVPIGTVDTTGGGGISLWQNPRDQVRYVIIDSNIIKGNSVSGTDAASAGVEVDDINALIQDNIIENNQTLGSSRSEGGGLWFYCPAGDTILMIRNVIRGHSVSTFGGAIYAAGPFLVLQNNIIAGNSAGVSGGVIRAHLAAKLILLNNTIADNLSANGSGIYVSNGAQVWGLNNIFANQNPPTQVFNAGGTVYLDHNLIFGQTVGTNSINADPKFVKFTDQYYIHDGPARDAGVVSATVGGVLLTAPTTDYRGMTRDGTPDLGAHEFDPAVGVEREANAPIPTEFALSQNYPNPFNPSTVISYQLSVYSNVRLAIYDVLGREVATLVSGEQPAGVYRAEWNDAVSSGVYFYRLEAIGNDGRAFVETKKMMLVR